MASTFCETKRFRHKSVISGQGLKASYKDNFFPSVVEYLTSGKINISGGVLNISGEIQCTLKFPSNFDLSKKKLGKTLVGIKKVGQS